MLSVVRLMDIKPQTAFKTPFREPNPAISHFKFGFSQKIEEIA